MVLPNITSWRRCFVARRIWWKLVKIMMFAISFIPNKKKERKKMALFLWQPIVAPNEWRHQNFSNHTVDNPRCLLWSKWVFPSVFLSLSRDSFACGSCISRKANYEYSYNFCRLIKTNEYLQLQKLMLRWLFWQRLGAFCAKKNRLFSIHILTLSRQRDNIKYASSYSFLSECCCHVLCFYGCS